MHTWDFAVDLDEARDEPLFQQLARGIADAIEQGRLRAGDALPGTRTLAQQLAVGRNTVVAALEELKAQGFVTTSPASASAAGPATAPAFRRWTSSRSSSAL